MHPKASSWLHGIHRKWFLTLQQHRRQQNESQSKGFCCRLEQKSLNSPVFPTVRTEDVRSRCSNLKPFVLETFMPLLFARFRWRNCWDEVDKGTNSSETTPPRTFLTTAESVNSLCLLILHRRSRPHSVSNYSKSLWGSPVNVCVCILSWFRDQRTKSDLE